MRAGLFALLLAVLAGIAGLGTPAQAQSRDPVLVPEISQHDIVLRQGFTGTELLLYGAVFDPRRRADNPRTYDIVVVLKGPSRAIRLREKEQIFGMWINSGSMAYRSVPSFYALSSSRPVADIVDSRTAAIFELGLEYLQLSPTGAIDPAEQDRFSAGLVDLLIRQGLYAQFDGAVTINESVLYSARLPIPSNVIPGRYVAETFAITEGRVVASATSTVQVRKEGFEEAVEEGAADYGLYYGLLAVAFSIGMGWLAGRLFALV